MERFIELGLKEIASIIQTLGEKNDVHEIVTMTEIGGKPISFRKKNNKLDISSPDGRKMSIAINYSEKEERDYQNRKIVYTSHEVHVTYYLADGRKIVLSNDMPLERGYEGFKRVQRHDLLRGLNCKYFDKEGKELASFSLELEKICLKDNNRVCSFSEEGINYCNKLISLDGEDVLSISGTPIPAIEDLQSFDVEKEKQRIVKLRDESENLHPFTREVLDDSLRLLDRKERTTKDILSFYQNELGDVRRAIEIRNKVEDALDKETFKADELGTISNMVREKACVSKCRK